MQPDPNVRPSASELFHRLAATPAFGRPTLSLALVRPAKDGDSGSTKTASGLGEYATAELVQHEDGSSAGLRTMSLTPCEQHSQSSSPASTAEAQARALKAGDQCDSDSE